MIGDLFVEIASFRVVPVHGFSSSKRRLIIGGSKQFHGEFPMFNSPGGVNPGCENENDITHGNFSSQRSQLQHRAKPGPWRIVDSFQTESSEYAVFSRKRNNVGGNGGGNEIEQRFKLRMEAASNAGLRP